MDVNTQMPPGHEKPGQGKADQGHTRPARRIPRGVQLLVVLAGAALLGVYVLLGSLFSKTEALPAPQASFSDSFKPTDAQWAGFKTAQAKNAAFSASQVTDGKIALDDDLSTQVFSPFTGRVTKLFVKAGDVVKAGDPLLGIQAAEFVQAANDLVGAIAGDRTAKAALVLAITSEKREHDLYTAGGGSLKDWQQSQSDLANARGTLNSAGRGAGCGAQPAAHPGQGRPGRGGDGNLARPDPV